MVSVNINKAMSELNYKPVFILSLMIACLMTSTEARELYDSIPRGWRAGNKTGPDFILGTDTVIKHSGKASAFIQREGAMDNESGVIMQSVAAEPYLNKRVRYSVYMRSSEVQSAYIFFAVHSSDSAIAYANNRPQALEGNTGWTLCQLTLDIPGNSRNLDFGVILGGNGKLWADDGKLEIVDASVVSNDLMATGQVRKQKLPPGKYPFNREPINLEFEQRP